MFYRHKVYGLEHYISGSGIIAPNHISFLDPPIIAVSWPEEIAFLARKSLFQKPILGSLISNLNAYPVSGSHNDRSSIKIITSLIQNGKKVVIFPEGYRSADGHLTEMKSGIAMIALRTQCPIIPAYIEGSYDIWSRHQRFPKLWGKTVCVFGSSIDTQRYNHLAKKEAQEVIADQVRDSIEALKTWYHAGAEGIPP